MKIAIVTPFFHPVGGDAQGYPGNIANILKKYKYSFDVLCSDVFPNGKEIKSKEETWNEIHIKRFKTYFNLSYFAKLWFPDVKNYDIVHCCGGYRHPSVFWAFLRSKKFLISPFYPVHNRGFLKNFLINLIDKTIGGYLLRNADYCLAETEVEAKWLKSLGVKRIGIIPNSAEEESFQKRDQTSFKKRHNLKGKMVLWVGRHHKIKNLEELIKIIPFVNATFVFCGGDTKITKEWKTLVKKLHVENKVKWVGDLKKNDKLDAYAACDLFVLPSKKEGLGGVLFGAMAQKKPVIASNVGGLPYVVADKFCLYESGNIEQLKEKINKLLNNETLATKLGNKGFIRVKKYFSFDKIAKDYVKILERL